MEIAVMLFIESGIKKGYNTKSGKQIEKKRHKNSGTLSLNENNTP
jgi:hypothetical protein